MAKPDYGNPSYWDERYAADERSYEWYQDYASLEEYIAPHLKIKGDFEILVAGCGNSRLGAALYDQGYVNITNIDSSQVLISQMCDTYTDREEMEYTVMDARKMDAIPEECFDLIIDKGLFDTVLTSNQNLSDIQQLLKEMDRVLKSDGVYIIVSHAGPDRRIHFIKHVIEVEVEVIPIAKKEVKGITEDENNKFHYVYICTKLSR